MNTTENNKLIAEFMGATIVEADIYLNGDEYTKYDLKFHSDWNWLMEVVEKIESLSHEQKVINWSRQNKNIFDLKLTESKIEAVYNACVTFIEWYNEQPK